MDGGSAYYLKPYSTGISLNVAGKIQASEFSGNLDGNATSATNAENLSLTTTTDTTCYLAFARTATTSHQKLYYDSNLQYNASNDRLGIRTSPSAELHVRQASDSFSSGIRLTESGGAGTWVQSIDTNNYLNFGYTTTASGTPSTWTHIFYTDGSFNINGSYLQSSDERLKSILGPIPNPIDKVKSLDGFFYNPTDYPDETRLGVSAQKVEVILPELVKENPTGYKSLNYVGLIPLLIEAIKEQQTQIDELKAQVNALSGT